MFCFDCRPWRVFWGSEIREILSLDSLYPLRFWILWERWPISWLCHLICHMCISYFKYLCFRSMYHISLMYFLLILFSWVETYPSGRSLYQFCRSGKLGPKRLFHWRCSGSIFHSVRRLGRQSQLYVLHILSFLKLHVLSFALSSRTNIVYSGGYNEMTKLVIFEKFH